MINEQGLDPEERDTFPINLSDSSQSGKKLDVEFRMIVAKWFLYLYILILMVFENVRKEKMKNLIFFAFPWKSLLDDVEEKKTKKEEKNKKRI